MKKLLTLFLLVITIQCPAQYLESSGELSGHSISIQGQGYSQGTRAVNFRGNIFHFYGKDMCLTCNEDYYFYKTSTTGTATNITFPYNTYVSNYNVTGYEDQHGNTYMQWETDYIGNFGGGLYNITGGYSSTLFKFTNNTIKWIIDFEPASTFYSDMDDNLYVQYNDHRIKKYDSTGTLIDSALFTTQTLPDFMDSLGGFYRYRNDSLIKFDFANNTLWQIYLPGSTVSYAMQGPEIFTSTAATITMVSLNGTVTSYPNASGIACNQYDLNGNYYQGASQKYNLNTGLVYNDTTVHFTSTLMDRTGRYYAFGYKEFLNLTTPTTYFLAPDYFREYTIGPLFNSHWFSWYQVFSTDPIDKNIDFNISTGFTYGFCNGGPGINTINFKYDKYPQPLSYLGVRVELSDSSGNFNNPVLLGITTTNQLKFNFPPGIIAGNNYRVRVIPNLQGYTYSNNVSPNFRIKQTPTANIAYSNCVLLSPVYNQIGFCDSLLLYAQTSSNAPTYLWENITSLGQGQYLYYNLGNTASIYLSQVKDYTRLTITDSSGCYNLTTVMPQKLNFSSSAISYTDTLNSNIYHTISLVPRYAYSADTIWGDFVFKNISSYYFNVDSAGPGWHYFYAAFVPQNVYGTPLCGNDTLVDSVYVYGYAAATLTAAGTTQLCVGDTATALITLKGTAPFTFYLKENNVRIGPFTTTQNTYTYKKSTTGPATITLKMDSVFDANGSQYSMFNGTVGLLFTNTVVPQVVATGPTSFCVGDSVRLSRTYNFPLYTYSWMRNGTLIPGASSVYYAKVGGVYSIKTSYQGCTKYTNSVTVSVPCSPPVPGDNDKHGNDTDNDAAMDNATAEPTITFTTDRSKILITCPTEFNLQSIALYDMSGRLVDKLVGRNKNTTEFTYTLPQLSNGVYTMQVVCNNKYVNKKITVSSGR